MPILPGYSILGDSISTFRGIVPKENRWFYDAQDTNGTGVCEPCETWWQRSIDALGAELVANASFSGSMVSGWGFPAGCSMKRARQLIGADGRVPDVVIVYMGINDYGWASPQAQAQARSVASPVCFDVQGRHLVNVEDIDGPSAPPNSPSAIDEELHAMPEADFQSPSYALACFEESYAKMLDNIASVAPKAQVQCMTLSPSRIDGRGGRFCFDLRGAYLDDYNDIIRKVALEKGAVLADVRAFGLDYFSSDGTHPDLVGMRQLSDLYLASIGVKGALDDYEDGMESQDVSLGIGDESLRDALIEEGRWGCYLSDPIS